MGLLIVAALTPSSFEIDLIDENKEDIDFSKGYNLVGLSAMTQQATRAYEITDNFRKRGIKVVIGGIHATVLPEEAKQHADSVVVGEAEYLWPEFLDDFQRGNIKPFYKSTKVVNLTDSPLPRYDLLKNKNYKVIWIQTTRGCPHDCDFCAASKVYGQKYRNKSIEQVINEVEFVKKIHGNIHIGFADDNMFVNRKLSKELLGRITALKIRWYAQSDISIAEDDDLLNLLRKSGCWMLFIGFESLSNENLKEVNKNGWKARQRDKYSTYIKKIQSYGIGIMGSFIVGFDNDDTSIFKETSNFIIDNNLFGAQVSILTPLPGTGLKMRLEKENRLLSTDWNDFTFFDATYLPKKMSIEQLENGIISVYKDIYNKETYFQKLKHFKEIYKNSINQC